MKRREGRGRGWRIVGIGAAAALGGVAWLTTPPEPAPLPTRVVVQEGHALPPGAVARLVVPNRTPEGEKEHIRGVWVAEDGSEVAVSTTQGRELAWALPSRRLLDPRDDGAWDTRTRTATHEDRDLVVVERPDALGGWWSDPLPWELTFEGAGEDGPRAPAHVDAVLAMALDRHSGEVWSLGSEGAVARWAPGKEAIRELDRFSVAHWVDGLPMLPNLLVSGSRGFDLNVLDAFSIILRGLRADGGTSLRTLLRDPESLDAPVLVSGDFHPHRVAHAALGMTNGEVRIWELDPPREILRLAGHEDMVFHVDLAHGGRWMASATLSGEVLVWDLDRAAFDPQGTEPRGTTHSTP